MPLTSASVLRTPCPILGLAHICQLPGMQVVDKGADAVLDEIEAAILEVAQSILQGNGFSYDVPSRAKSNQLYVPELDRIVLKDSTSKRPFASTQQCRKTAITTRILALVHELCLKQINVTKRDLFYTDVKLFEVRAWVLLGKWQCHAVAA